MARVRVCGKIQESKRSRGSESSHDNTSSSENSSEYETDTDFEKKEKHEKEKEKQKKRRKVSQRKRKNTRCRSQDSRRNEHRKRQRRDRRCQSHDGRLPEDEVRHAGLVTRYRSPRGMSPPKTVKTRGGVSVPVKRIKVKRAKKNHRSRSATRTSSHTHSHVSSCTSASCHGCKRRKKRRTDAELFPQVSVFNLQLIGDLQAVIDFIFAKKKWLIIHLTDLTSAIKAVPVDFWMDDNIVKLLEGAAYVLQISLDTMDGRNVVYKYRCLSREGIIIIDPVNLGKRAFWQCFRHVDDIFPELLIFIDSQTFYLDNGKRKYFPGKKSHTWPHTTLPHLLPGPSKKFDKNKKMVDKSPSKSPSLSSLSESATTFETRSASTQSEPLNLSRKMSATTDATSSSSSDEEEYFSDESRSSQTVNISESPTFSPIGPHTPPDEPYNPLDQENSEEGPETLIDPQKLVDQTRAALRKFESSNPIQDAELGEMIPPDVGMGGDSVNIVDEINMQRAIIQSLGIELDGSDAELAEAMRPPSPCPDFNIRPNSPVNTMEPIVEISTMEDAMNTSMLASMHASLNPPPMHTPMQSPMLRTQQIPPGTQTVAVMPFKNPDGKTALKLLPYKGEGRPSGEVVPGQGVQPAQLARALMPYAENRFPAHTGDGVYAGGSAQPYTLSKRQMTICFVLPWGTRYYARELHTDNTMQDLLDFLQGYLQKFEDIDWSRDIIDLKMTSPCRNLSKLSLKTKLRDAKLGKFPVIFVIHYQFLDRAP